MINDNVFYTESQTMLYNAKLLEKSEKRKRFHTISFLRITVYFCPAAT